jgi:GMP synthase-like glutamine amidotransferase
MKLLRVHCFQHVDYEDLGCIKDWCKMKGHQITYTRFYKGESLTQTANFDWLIVMGGPMGVYDNEKYCWLSNEKKVIETAIQHNKTVIGICLGSQLVAEVLGAKIYRNLEKEIGWFDVMLTEQGKRASITNGIQTISKVFHWHGDTFDLPLNTIHLSYSEACKNQSFLYKDNVLGLQFHFEVTEKSIKSMIKHGKHELKNEKYIQSEKEILSLIKNVELNNKTMFQILDNLAK